MQQGDDPVNDELLHTNIYIYIFRCVFILFANITETISIFPLCWSSELGYAYGNKYHQQNTLYAMKNNLLKSCFQRTGFEQNAAHTRLTSSAGEHFELEWPGKIWSQVTDYQIKSMFDS